MIPKEESPFEKYCSIVNTPPTSNAATAAVSELPPELLVSTDTETDDEISVSGASDDETMPILQGDRHKIEKVNRLSRHPGNDDDDQSGTFSKGGSSGGQSHKRSHSKVSFSVKKAYLLK